MREVRSAFQVLWYIDLSFSLLSSLGNRVTFWGTPRQQRSQFFEEEMQSNAVKFDNVWQLRPSSSNSFSGETFATRQAFESNLRINWKCKVLFESAILHMSGRQIVGSSKQSYCQNSTGTGFIIFTCSYIFLTYLQFTKIQKKYGLRDRCTSRGIFSNFGTDWMPVAWLAGLYGLMFVGFLGVFSCSIMCLAFIFTWGPTSPTSYRKMQKTSVLFQLDHLYTTLETGHSERRSDKSRSKWDLALSKPFQKSKPSLETLCFASGIVSWKCP